jgi:HAD superfamily hydrolase (TIGR01662 family)
VASPEAVRQAATAEMTHYKRNALRGKDESSLAQLRGECAAVLKRTLEEQGVAVSLTREETTEVLLSSIRFGVYPEVADVLRSLKENGFRLGVVSNWDYRLPVVLNDLGIGRFFDFVLTSAACGCEKPDARIFQEALRRARAEPEETMHVGDSCERDVQGAQRVGIHAVLLQRESDEGSGNVCVIHDLSELLQVINVGTFQPSNVQTLNL